MQVIFFCVYKFVMKAIRFDTLFSVLAPLFYLKDHNNLYFYKLLDVLGKLDKILNSHQ